MIPALAGLPVLVELLVSDPVAILSRIQAGEQPLAGFYAELRALDVLVVNEPLNAAVFGLFFELILR